MDIERDRSIPLIFGWSFLATDDVFIGVRERTVTFNVNQEEMMFDAESIPHYPNEEASCFVIHVIPLVEESNKDVMDEIPKDACVDEVYESKCIG